MSARLFSAARPPRQLRRALAATALSGVGLLLLAAPAGAHVTVGADDNHQGASDAVLTFRVPNEEDTATTVRVTVNFPTKNPLASVKPAPKPGWTLSTKTVTFAQPITTDDGTLTSGIGQVTWTANSPAAAIPVGGFDAFSVLVGPLPEKAAELGFATLQTYSDGKTVSWIEPTPPGGPEPELPAPILTLASAAGGADTVGTTESASGDAGPAASPQASAAADAVNAVVAGAPSVTSTSSGDYATKSDASTGRTLGLVGLVVGALGLLAGAAAFVRSGRGKA